MIARSSLPVRVTALSLGAVVASAVMLAAPVSPAQAASGTAVTFDYTGVQTSWVVPAHIASLQVVVAGASGVDAGYMFSGGVGGTGGTMTVDLGTRFAGKTFQILVGGTGDGSLPNQGFSQQAAVATLVAAEAAEAARVATQWVEIPLPVEAVLVSSRVR